MLFLRRYKNNKPFGFALQLISDFFVDSEDIVNYVREQYIFEKDSDYRIEDTYGKVLIIIKKEGETIED